MAETKKCEQCQSEKDIECFYRRPQKKDPNKRIKICIDCYKANLAETNQRSRELHKQWQEEQQRRAAQQEAERIAREQEAQRRQVRAMELTLQANKLCPRCKQPRTDGHLFIEANGEERLYFHRYCQACTDATSHIIYRLICPLLNQTRYVGITCQPLERRLAGHMRNESGTECKSAWIETLRAQGLRPLIEQIDTAPNEEQAKKAEQFWIDHYLRLGCPLTNSEACNAQRVLDVQCGRTPSLEEKHSLYHSAQHFRFERATAKALQIARWRNRKHCAYFLDTTYHPRLSFAPHHYQTKAQEYDRAIMDYTLPDKKKDRQTVLSHVTIAYVYWDERYHPWQKTLRGEDVRYLWERHIPLIGAKRQQDGTSVTGFVMDLTPENVPIVHPFSYTVDSAHALITSPIQDATIFGN